MKVLVCGGREYADRDRVATILGGFNSGRKIDLIIEGGAKGADSLAREWAIENGVAVKTVYADWEKHGRAAGPIRNKQMLDGFSPDLVVSFAGGRGTENMVRQAISAGVDVLAADEMEDDE